MIRESSVVSGTEFLSHPSVIPHSREEKTSFLRGKGLTSEEIDEAFTRVEGSRGPVPSSTTAISQPGTAAAPAGQQQPGYPPQSYPAIQPQPHEEQWSFFSNVLAPASLALSAGASALYFYKTYINHENAPGAFPWEANPGGGLQPPPLFQEPIIPGAPAPVPQQPPSLPGQPPQQQQQQPQLPGQPNQPWSPFVPLGLQQQQQPQPQQQQQLTANATSSVSEAEQLRKSIEEQSTAIRDMLSSLKDVVSTLKETKNQSNSSSSEVNVQMIIQAMQASSDVKSELSAIKTLLLANLVKGGAQTSNNSSSTGETVDQQTADLQALLTSLSKKEESPAFVLPKQEEEKSEQQKQEEADELKRRDGMDKARQALALVVQQCSADQPEQLVSGCNMLLMFLKNIIKDPMNPRYRRVARGNANFKKSLEPLSGHLQFFESVGFEERGSLQLELKSEWTENLETQLENGWARAIIEDAIANLESVKEQYVGATATSSPSVTPASASPLRPTASKALPPSATAAIASNASTASKPTTAKWQPPVLGASLQDPVQNPVPPPPGRQPQQPQPEKSELPSYPLSFAEVARLHAEGKRPDGIKDIPDRLSSDEPSKPSMAAPLKPWETISTTSSPSPASAWSAPRIGSKPKVEIVELKDDGSVNDDENGNNTSEGEQ